MPPPACLRTPSCYSSPAPARCCTWRQVHQVRAVAISVQSVSRRSWTAAAVVGLLLFHPNAGAGRSREASVVLCPGLALGSASATGAETEPGICSRFYGSITASCASNQSVLCWVGIIGACSSSFLFFFLRGKNVKPFVIVCTP